jgi:uncharacterized membrane protein
MFSDARVANLNSMSSSSNLKYTDESSAEAKVIGLVPNSDGNNKISNKVKVEITTGKHKGQILEVDNLIGEATTDKNQIEDYNVEKGNEVILDFEEDSNGNIKDASISDFVRYKNLAIIVVIFIMLQIIIGGKKGIMSLITLALTIIFVTKIIIPLILSGNGFVIPTIIICILILVINFLLVSGFSKKTLGAILGTSLGMVISGILFYISGHILRVTGMGYTDIQDLTVAMMGKSIDFRGIFFACVMLGSLGALMDIGITISSTMYEMKTNNPNISEKELIKSGMNVGKDIMGTMSNTLILAYLGGAMILLLVYASDNMSFIDIVNQDVVASEILKALIGGIGIILTIPITVLIMTKLNNIHKPIRKNS